MDRVYFGGLSPHPTLPPDAHHACPLQSVWALVICLLLPLTLGGKLEVPSGKTPPQRKKAHSFRKPKRPTPAESSKPAKKIKLSRRLSKLINYIQSVHFDGFGNEGKIFALKPEPQFNSVDFSKFK